MRKPIRLISLLFIFFLATGPAPAEQSHQAQDGSFTLSLPDGFTTMAAPPAGTVLALETPGSSFNLFFLPGEAVELEPALFAERMKRNLFDNGAQIYEKSQVEVGGVPAAKFFVGGLKPGRESIFIFIQHPKTAYTVVMNYPAGQRDQAKGMWATAAQSLKFKD